NEEPVPPSGGSHRLWPWAAVIAAGVVVRVGPYLGRHSYWYDEACLLLNVLERSYAGLLEPLAHNQAAPPLFVIMLRVLANLFGMSEWVMRLPAFLAGLAALGVMIPLARRVVGGPGSVWAVGLCAASYRAVYHGCEVKPYDGDVLVTILILLTTMVMLGTD